MYINGAPIAGGIMVMVPLFTPGHVVAVAVAAAVGAVPGLIVVFPVTEPTHPAAVVKLRV